MTRHTIRSPGDAGQGSHIPISQQQQQWRLQKNPGAQEDGARIAGAATAPAHRLKHSRSPAPGVNGKWSSVRIQREGASEMGGRMKLAGAEVVGFSAPQRGSLGGDLGLFGDGLGMGCGVCGGGWREGLRPEPVAASRQPPPPHEKRYNEKSTGVPLVWG